MQIINKGNEDILKVWGEGKILPVSYRLITYTLSQKVEDGTLLYNLITGELLLLNEEEWQKLSLLPGDYAPWMDELIRKHYLVKTDSDDRYCVDMLRRMFHSATRSKAISSYTVLPTTACNARCFYCYEAGMKSETMSDETADKLVNFITANHKDEKVSLHWFGGEPLLAIQQIDRICKALKDRKIDFSSTMISNGYLFDEVLVRRIGKDWNFTSIQITLDGTEKVYNRTKAYVTPCESPYQRVLENIAYLLQNDISVHVRLNLGKHNGKDLIQLVKELSGKFPDKKNLRVYSHLLFENCGFMPTHFSDDELEVYTSQKDELDSMIDKAGFSTSKHKLPHLKCSNCMADDNSSVIVLPSGKLAKCEHYITEHFLGDLDTGICDKNEIRLFKEVQVYSHCNDCPLYPACIRLKMCINKGCTPKDEMKKVKDAVRNITDYYRKFSCCGNKK